MCREEDQPSRTTGRSVSSITHGGRARPPRGGGCRNSSAANVVCVVVTSPRRRRSLARLRAVRRSAGSSGSSSGEAVGDSFASMNTRSGHDFFVRDLVIAPRERETSRRDSVMTKVGCTRRLVGQCLKQHQSSAPPALMLLVFDIQLFQFPKEKPRSRRSQCMPCIRIASCLVMSEGRCRNPLPLLVLDYQFSPRLRAAMEHQFLACEASCRVQSS